jgi:hypothetical protein
MRATAALLALVAVLGPAAAGAQPAPAEGRRTKILVFDFTVKGDAAKDLGRVLADVAARELAKLRNVQALTQADVTAQLGVEKQKTMLGCAEDRSCMAEIAGAIDADRTLGGSVVQLGDASLVSVTYVDARKAATVGGDQETLRNAKMDQLVDAVRRLAFFAATGQRLETTGAIDFNVAEEGAKVLLDGEELGTGPYKATRRATEGSHRVHVAKEGFATWETELRVTAGGTVTVAPRLAALPKPPPVQQVTVVQQVVVKEDPDRFWKHYVEFRFALLKPFEYRTEGVESCIDSLSSGVCMGPRISVRYGYRFDAAWAVEGGGDYFSFARSGEAGYADTKGPGLFVGGSYHPAGNRWFALAAEAGLKRTTVEIEIAGAGVTEKAWRPFATGEARLDFPLGEFLLGLRAGLQWIGSGDRVEYSAYVGGPTSVTLAVQDGPIVSFFGGVGMGFRL